MNIQQALAALGSTAEQVAQTLKAKGIKGVRAKIGSCPVASYLQRECYDDGITVGLSCAGNDNLVSVSQQEEIPDHVRKFVRDFDDGLYPELERR